MQRLSVALFLAIALLSTPVFAFSMGSGSYKITDAVIAAGGDVSTSGSYRLDMTLGQAVADISSGSSYIAYLGRTWNNIYSFVSPEESGVYVVESKITVNVGKTARINAKITNRAPGTEVFPLHIGSIDQSGNWAWFTGHRADEKRHDINVTIGPRETKLVTIDFFGAMPGKYTLILGPDGIYENRYEEISIKVIHKGKGLFSTTPDMRVASFLIIVLVAAAISAAGAKKETFPATS